MGPLAMMLFLEVCLFFVWVAMKAILSPVVWRR